MADQGLGVHAAQFFLTHREGDHRHVLGLQAGVAQFLVEGHVGVTVDGGHHSGLATGAELFDVGHDGLVVGVAKRGVLLVDVLVGHALALEVGTQDLVGGAGVHIVGAQQHPPLGTATVLAHQVVDRGNGLLVGRGAGVEHVFGQLFTFVLHGVEQQAIEFFHDRQHRLATHRSPATEDDGHLVLRQQLLGFFCKQGPVGSRVDHHRLELLAQHTALGVDFVDGHEHGVLEHRLGNRHGARQAVQHADLDGVGGLRLQGNGQRACGHSSSECEGLEVATTVHHEITPLRKV